MAKESKIKVASVLAFEKKLVSSDGYLSATNWNNRAATLPLALQEKTIRGTISNRFKKADLDDPAKINKKVSNANIQLVDACALPQGYDTLKMSFTLKVLGNVGIPSACDSPEFKSSLLAAVADYKDKYEFTELSLRYATTLANAKYLWRNRLGAEAVQVVVSVGSEVMEFNALEFALNSFDVKTPELLKLAGIINSALVGDSFELIKVDVYAKVGDSQEVYPSEEMVLEKGDKSKVLYSVNGVAALHSQKIGNALRSIDTWYPEFTDEEKSGGAIAIETYGSVTTSGKAFRNPKETKKDFYTLFDKFSTGEELGQEEDLHYVMAMLVRGGVFGESGKE